MIAGRVIYDVLIPVDINPGNVMYEVTTGKSAVCMLETRLKLHLKRSPANYTYIVREIVDAGGIR